VNRLTQLLEAALFAAAHPLPLSELAKLQPDASHEELLEGLRALRDQYERGGHALSQAALETLAVIAYRQPVSRAEIEEIRGVSVDGVLRSLQERGIIEAVGRGEGLGRPMLYGTTALFFELLGVRSLDELPRLEELSVALRPPSDLGELTGS
jgi:segregation and condensation protein B